MVLLVSTVALAKQPNPEIYWGRVYLDGSYAPNGGVLTVETASGELLINETLPKSGGHPGSYSISVQFDDLLTNATDEGAENLEQLVWKLDGIEVVTPLNDTAVIGETNNEFNVTAVTIPQVTIGNLFYTSITVGQVINDTLSLDNTGAGDGDVTIALNYNASAYDVTTNLPLTPTLSANSSTNERIEIIPNACGSYNLSLQTDVLDTAGRLRTTKSQDITFDYTGPNLVVTNIDSGTLTVNEVAQLSVKVQNSGNEDITGFNTSVKIDNVEIGNTYANYTLTEDENLSIGTLWTPTSAGTYNITAEITTTELECTSTDNIFSKIVTVQAATSGGGGSGGSGGSGGGSSSGGSCTPEWECTEWGECGYFSGVRTRTCEDKKECGTLFNKPEEEEQCRGVPACTDGMLNGQEEDIDCGGLCEACPIQTAEEENKPKTNLITGDAVDQEEKGMQRILDFPSLLLAFMTLVFLMGYVFIYKNMDAQSYEQYSVKILDDPGTKKQYAYVPFEYMMQAADIIDNVHSSKLSQKALKEQFEKQKYSPVVARLALKAVRSTGVVMKNEARIRKELAALEIGKEGYDYISYTTLSKSVKLMAELFKVIKDDKERKKIVKLAVAGLGSVKTE